MIVRAGSMASTGLRLVVLLSVVLSFSASPSGAASGLAYDSAGRLASVASPTGSVSYTFDDAGNRATMTTRGVTATYGYDAADRLASVARPDLGTFSFGYDFDGRLTSLTRPNGVTSTNTYDTAGRLWTLTYKNSGSTTIAAYAYTLDAAGNRTGVSGTAGSESYTLDPAGRLTGVTYADGTTIGFTYDPAGNRATMTAAGTTTPYTYDDAGQLKSAGSTDYTYDPAGNRTSAGSSSYSYDDFGNLASATWGVVSIAYASNGDGLRVRAISAGSTTTYAWDEAAALPSLLSDGTSGYLSADATLLAETSASANAYPLTDALGSVRAQTDGTGSLTASASYDVFGSVRSSTGSIGSLAYTGALSDSSGLTYLQARELDSSTGTFTSRDPLTPGGSGITGFNPYAYAGQNPTTYTDPSGRGIRLAEIAAILSSETVVFATLVVAAYSITNSLALCAFGYLRCPGLPTSGAPDIPAPNIPIPNVGLPDIGGLLKSIQQALSWSAVVPLVAALAATGIKVMVADSNVFMDVMDPAANAARTALFADPRSVLLVPLSAVAEITPTPTQLARLARAIPIPDAPLSASDLAALVTGPFNRNDAHIVETACVLHLPLVTANTHMATQVSSYPPRAQRWGGRVTFIALP
jgi:RHS repeat-associated protein